MLTTKRRTGYGRFGLILSVIATPLVLLAAVMLAANWAGASSHREAPLISQDAFADNTDTYVWIPRGQTANIVLAASWIPFEGPEGGPNYWEWGKDVLYDIYVDVDGDATADVTYTLSSRVEIGNPDTFLYNTGTIGSPSDTNWNRRQFVTVTESWEPGMEPSGSAAETIIVDDQVTAPVNIGDKSTPNYQALADAAIYSFVDSNEDLIKTFGGQTDDAFFVDLQVFDLLTLRGQDPPIGYKGPNNRPVDSVSGYNVHSLVLELPIARLVRNDEPVLGVWAGSRRPSLMVVGGTTPTDDYVQVSRLGMPLVNEVVIPMGLKDVFNSIPPSADLPNYSLLQKSVENPEVGTLLCALYGVPLPGDSDADCNTEFTPGTARSGRGDIFDIFLTGMVLASPFTITTASGPVMLPAGFNVNQPSGVVPAEMIRINTAISGDLCAPEPSRLGILGGDACGFPNGRRLTDDATDIELLAVAGAAYQVLDGRDTGFSFNPDLINVLTDRVDKNDVRFRKQFPYMALAQSGQTHLHQNQRGPRSDMLLTGQPADSTLVSLPAAQAGTVALSSVSLTGSPLVDLSVVLLLITAVALAWWRHRRQASAPA